MSTMAFRLPTVWVVACVVLAVSFIVVVDAVCKDKLHDCKNYGKKSCHGAYTGWAKKNCPAYCGYCKAPPPPPCVDAIPKCSNYQSDTCTASKYRPWAEKHCRRYCRFCTDAQLKILDSRPSAYCKDKIKDCEYFPHGSCTGKYTGWAKKNCAATCKYCKPLYVKPKPCVDHVPNCKNYLHPEKFCKERIYRKWADDHCRKFCKFC